MVCLLQISPFLGPLTLYSIVAPLSGLGIAERQGKRISHARDEYDIIHVESERKFFAALLSPG